MILMIFSTGAFLLLFIFGFYWVYAIIKGAPYYPSSTAAVRAIIDVISSQKNAKIVELGAGDGKIAIALAKKGFAVSAIELNPILTVITRLKAKLAGADLKVINADFLRCDLSEYNIALAYLYPGIMQKLEPKLFKEMPKGSMIISNTFSIKSREPYKKIEPKILIYKVG